MLSSIGVAYPPLSQPPVPSPLQALTSGESDHHLPAGGAAASSSYNHSLIIIAGILAFVVVASTSIHLLLRLLSGSESSSPPELSRGHATSTSSSVRQAFGEHRVLMESLPIFSLTRSSSAAADCAVCLSRFLPGEELRYLPACRHTFHSSCIASWILSAPSCPLCRSPIHLPPPPPPSPPPPKEEEEEGKEMSCAGGPQPAPPGEEVAEAVGPGGGGWLREFVDRLASPASSSFSSRRLSPAASSRFAGGDTESDGVGSGRFCSASASASASHRWPAGPFP